MAKLAHRNCSGRCDASQIDVSQSHPRASLIQYFIYMSGIVAAPREGSIEVRVRYAETDQMGVVYHANYLVWCEIGRTDLIRQLGTSYADLERQGVGLAVIDASLRYHSAARYDDLIRVRTVISDVRSRTVTFDYTIEHAENGLRLATARTTLASLSKEGKLVALPQEIRKLMEDARS
jgi:acyl-CoA thioester hydrolase